MGNLFSKKKKDDKAAAAAPIVAAAAAAPTAAAEPAAATATEEPKKADSAAEPAAADAAAAVPVAAAPTASSSASAPAPVVIGAAPVTPAKTDKLTIHPASPASSFARASFKPIVICGPSGVGKGTLTGMLFADLGEHFSRKISHTTRPPRVGEVHGVSYHFVSHEAFEEDMERGAFIETAKVHGKYYGTAFSSIESAIKAGKIVILELDVQGVQSVRASQLSCNYLWIAPPTYDELSNRLAHRGTETADVIATRLGTALEEKKAVEAHPDMFDHTLVNDDLNEAYRRLTTLLSDKYPHMKDAVTALWAEKDATTAAAAAAAAAAVAEGEAALGFRSSGASGDVPIASTAQAA